jgi:hypothetical protein
MNAMKNRTVVIHMHTKFDSHGLAYACALQGTLLSIYVNANVNRL